MQQAAVIIVAYLAVIGLTHFRVEALATAAALATFMLAFIRHVAEARTAGTESARDEPARDDAQRDEQARTSFAGHTRMVARMRLRDPDLWGDPGPAHEVFGVPRDDAPDEQHAVTIAVSVTIVPDGAR